MAQPLDQVLASLLGEPPPGGVEEDLEAFLQRFEASRAGGSAGELPLRRRCAVPRCFDEGMVDAVLRAGPPEASQKDVPFSRLLQHKDVERLAGRPGLFRLRDSARQALLEQLPEAERIELHRRLAAHCADRDESWQSEHLYHLALAEPVQAAALLERLFGQADARFDLARCYDLLRTLEQASDPALCQLRNSLRAYYEARCLFADEYYRTAQYLQRHQIEQGFATLLKEPNERWLCQVYATGGMGKTMALRWLLARRCVLERIPCACLDFDLIDPVLTALQPWRLLHGFAEQLSVQLTNAPFGELLAELRARVSVEAQSHGTAPEPEHLSADVRTRFAAILRETCGQRPIALILDTYEEILLRQQNRLMDILEYLAKIHEDCPNVRLILAGRYALRERLPDFAAKFDGVLFSVPLSPFTREEGLAYLRECRALDARLPLDAAVERSEGIPFKLALFADILQQNPRLTADAIRSYPSVDLLYLIERIIERIPEKLVRWLLRYGVVPRRLNLQFVEQVMAPYLPRVLAGEEQLDNPAQDIGVPESKRAALFPRQGQPEGPAEGAIDLRALWQELEKYASASAWVSRDKDSDTLLFHNEVINPMRRLLQPHPVYGELHRDALSYFEARAAKDPEQRGRWLAEATYHRFQLGPAREAGAHFTAQLRDVAESDPRLCEQLARAVLGTEYVDAEGQPLPRSDGTPLIERETLLAASYSAASSILQQSRRPEDYANARRHLERAEALASESAESLQRAWQLRLALLRSQVEQGHDLEAALSIARQAWSDAQGQAERLAATVRLGEVLAELRQEEALRWFLEAESLGAASLASAAAVQRMRVQQAELLADFTRYGEALEVLEHTSQEGLSAWAQATRLRASWLLQAGRPAESLRALEELCNQGENLDLSLERARAFIALGDADRAIALVAPIDERFSRTNPRTPIELRLRAATSELLGLLSQEQLGFRSEPRETEPQVRAYARDSLAHYERAAQWWREGDSLEGEGRCVLRLVELSRSLGRELQTLVPTIKKAGSRLLPGSDAGMGLRLVDLELAASSYGAGEIDQRLLVLRQDCEGRPPHLLLRWALGGLLLARQHKLQAEDFASFLIRALAALPAVATRLAWLVRLGTEQSLLGLEALDAGARERMTKLLSEPAPSLMELDRALLQRRQAWIFMMLRDPRRSQAAWDEASALLRASREPSAVQLGERWREWPELRSMASWAADPAYTRSGAPQATERANTLLIRVDESGSGADRPLISASFSGPGLSERYILPVPPLQDAEPRFMTEEDAVQAGRFLSRQEREGGIDVRLEIAAGELQSLAWELLLLDEQQPLAAHRGVRSLYRSSRAAPPRGRSAAAPSPPVAAILEPVYQENSFQHQRGVRSADYSELQRHYSAFNASLIVLRPEAIAYGSGVEVQGPPPQVIHICGTLIPGPEVCLDLGLGARSELSARRLASFLRPWQERGAPPLLILEVPPSGSHSEAARQIRLRNMFAAELWNNEAGAAVLGVGPVQRRNESFFRRELLGSMSQHASIGAVVSHLRTAHRDVMLEVEDIVLFTDDPDWCPLPA